jgi:hypothetical protein
MDPNNAVIWIFLVIFALTGVLTLASIAGRIRVKPYYEKKLFVALVLELIGCVIVFGGQALTSRATQDNASEMVMDYSQGWHAQYAERGWRARYRFIPTKDGKMTMVGSTYLVSDAKYAAKPIINWESAEPFDVDPTKAKVTFRARRAWTDVAAAVYPELRYEVGKKTDVQITLAHESALRGVVANGNSAEIWGLTMTPAPR